MLTRRAVLVVAVLSNTFLTHSVEAEGPAEVPRPTFQAMQPTEVDSLKVLESARSALRDHRGEVLFDPESSAALMMTTNFGPTQLAGNFDRAARTRHALISTLDSLAGLLPGDDFIHGHRVGFRFLDGDLAGALEVANECRGSDWWCEALTGFLLHESGDFAGARSAFNNAVAGMPLLMRCEWQSDMTILMDRDLAEEWRNLLCLDRAQMEDRFWWLADPILLMHGNDRQTEHYSRQVAWELWVGVQGIRVDGSYSSLSSRSSRSLFPTFHAVKIAHDWPEWWWGYEGPPWPRLNQPGYRFTPSNTAIHLPTQSSRADWELQLRAENLVNEGRGFRAEQLRNVDWGDRYLPSYTIHEDLSDQTAFFARGDSFAVAAATDLRGHPLAIRRPLDVGIVLMRDELDESTIAWGEEVGVARYLFRTTILAEAHLVSIEALSGEEAAARVRFGHGLPDREEGALGLSDLLLFEWQEELPEELDAVAPHMLGSTRLTGNDAVGLYWEMYGLEDAAGLEVSVTVQRQDAGFFRRLGQALRLVGERDGPSVRWEEGERDEEVAGRTLRLDLSGLEAGQYVLELEVRAQDGREAVATREFVRVGG